MVKRNSPPRGDLAELRRKAFRALVEAQDTGLSVPDARAKVAERFGWDEADVRVVEEEGLRKQWPPL
jgi:hypothetical protein